MPVTRTRPTGHGNHAAQSFALRNQVAVAERQLRPGSGAGLGGRGAASGRGGRGCRRRALCGAVRRGTAGAVRGVGGRAGGSGGGARAADPGGYRVRDRQRPAVRGGAARDDRRAGGRDPAGGASGAPGDPDRPGRLLCPRGAVPAAVCAGDDDRAGEGGGGRRGGRLPAAERAPGDDRGVPPVGRGSDLPHRRGAGDRRHGLRDRERTEGREDRRAGQRLRQRGEAAGVRAGRDRPAGGAVGDLRAGRRDR